MSRRSTWLAATLIVVLAGIAGCSNDDSGDSLVGRSGLGAEDRVTVTADPQEIVIDPQDPDTPTDPDSGEALGQSVIRALVRDANGEPESGVDVTFETDGGTLQSAGQPVVTDEMGIAQDVLVVAESDPDQITVRATAGEDSGTTIVTKTVVVPNAPPVADAGADQTIECGDEITLDGSASSDPDSTDGTNDDIVLYEWSAGEVALGEGATLAVPSADLGVGLHVVTLSVTDAAGASSTDETAVTIVDETPPDLSVALDPSTIWPPNHKWVDVHADLTVEEACAAVEQLVIVLLSVDSDEPTNANGDGNSEPDVDGVDPGTPDLDFRVRAERAGPGDGRVYTATYSVVDPSGNEATASGEARVRHDQGARD